MNFLGLILLCVLLLSIAVSTVVFMSIQSREMDAIKDRAVLVADILNNVAMNNDSRFADFSNYDPQVARVTIIAPDGEVLLDNKAITASLENHSDRKEFIQALQDGHGDARRYSSTLGAETYYYAILLNDGNVLRVSKTTNIIAGVFTSMLPAFIGVVALILILANIVAHRLTRNIVQPLGNINYSAENPDVYDELLPYIKRIEQQKKEIDNQVIMLRKRTDTIENITSSMKEGLILIDKHGVVQSVNKSASDIFRENNAVGKNVKYICREIEFIEGVEQCLSGKVVETKYKRDDKLYNVFFSCVYDEGELSGGVIFLLDISEKHEAEKQRREFSANVSHELKTPLTTISSLAEMIDSGMARDDDVRTFAGKILIQTKRLINIIEDIIKLSEFDEGETVSAYTDFDLTYLAESVIDALREKSKEKNVSVSLVGERFNVTANSQMIDELLFNLIDNAINYNIDEGSVVVTLSKEKSLCKISVSDTGVGIPPEHQSRVFERFYRVDKSRSKKTGGTGLGLSIVKHIAEHHGGQAVISSIEGKGTTIECLLPI